MPGYNHKDLFVAKHGSMAAVKRIASESPVHGTRMMALARWFKEEGESDGYKKAMHGHLTKIFETGERHITSMHIDSSYLTWSHMDIISKHFPEHEERNKNLNKRLRNKAMYSKEMLDRNEL